MDQLLNHVRGFSFGEMTYERGGLFGPILRPYLSLIVVASGACTLQADGNAVKVSGGQSGIAAASERFEFAYQRGTSTEVMWCEGFLPDRPLPEFQIEDNRFQPIETTDNIRQLLKMGIGAGDVSRPDLNAMRDALGQAACRTFLYEARKGIADRKIPLPILVARRFIKENLGDENVDVQRIAANSGITRQHLITSFKRHLGTTPSRYLWRLRANRAREMLVHTQLSQPEIAHTCGYKSLPHYSRSLKSRFGMTPSQIRQDMGFTQPSNTDASVEDVVY